MRRPPLLIWAAAAAGLFVLSLDFWRWTRPTTIGPLGLPRWVWWYVALQLLLAAVVAGFARHGWRNPGDDDKT